MAGEKQGTLESKDTPQIGAQTENHGLTDAVSKIWEGPKDGSAPGCVVSADVWQKAEGSNMSVDEAIKIVQDAAGGQKMEFPPIFPVAPPIGPGPDGRPAGMGEFSYPDLRKSFEKAGRSSAEDIIHSSQIGPDGMSPEFKKDMKINEDVKHLSPEQQKEVKDGIQAVRDHNPQKIAEFLEHATPEEKAAFIKALKDIGYKVEDTPPSIEEQMRIGGPTHEHLRISDPNSILPCGVDVTVTRNPSTGPMDHPHADVAFER